MPCSNYRRSAQRGFASLLVLGCTMMMLQLAMAQFQFVFPLLKSGEARPLGRLRDQWQLNGTQQVRIEAEPGDGAVAVAGGQAQYRWQMLESGPLQVDQITLWFPNQHPWPRQIAVWVETPDRRFQIRTGLTE